MRKRWLILALVFSVMVNVAAIGTIGYHWWRARSAASFLSHPGGPMLKPMRRALSLNPAQMRELGEQRRQIAEEIEKNQQDLVEARARLMELLRSPAPDSMAVEEILEEMTSAQMTMQRTVLRNLLRMKRELTPEQQERLLRMMERRPGWDMGPGLGHRRMRGRLGPADRRIRGE